MSRTSCVDAIVEAFDDAGVDEVDAVFIGTVYEPFGSGQRVLERLGIAGVPVVNGGAGRDRRRRHCRSRQ